MAARRALIFYQGSEVERPRWLDCLLKGEFFSPCTSHVSLKKNEMNLFCMDCMEELCQHCMSSHQSHKMLQIRRYVYHDVVRLQDITKLVDCGGVQAYIVNGSRVVFLNQRPQPRPTKTTNSCITCARMLQDEFSYCCLGCKVEALERPNTPSSEPIKKGSNQLMTSLASSDSGSFTSQDEPSPMKHEDSRNFADSDSGSSFDDKETTSHDLDYSSVPKRSRNSRSSWSSSPRSVLPSLNRRKSTPQRAPAY
ncbi:hypothetical protein CLOM_g118 [Closterium sp. NIES-68]|nr:hypothetical protein CLOM_g16791 [Closterium sp. NIES-68]GJP40442.1 hypothetical protein CLOM_g118 [Closterium sp. NIES-68]GJP75584.1 hypothetical protein CLOP_g6014 [Closterium sp. NIES-67]